VLTVIALPIESGERPGLRGRREAEQVTVGEGAQYFRAYLKAWWNAVNWAKVNKHLAQADGFFK
jgi:hypothetical protein